MIICNCTMHLPLDININAPRVIIISSSQQNTSNDHVFNTACSIFFLLFFLLLNLCSWCTESQLFGCICVCAFVSASISLPPLDFFKSCILRVGIFFYAQTHKCDSHLDLSRKRRIAFSSHAYLYSSTNSTRFLFRVFFISPFVFFSVKVFFYWLVLLCFLTRCLNLKLQQKLAICKMIQIDLIRRAKLLFCCFHVNVGFFFFFIYL